MSQSSDMFVAKTPEIIKPLARSLLFRIPVHRKAVFLTFDDGPVPEATPFVLDTLAEVNAKATFFCVGSNLEKHPEITRRILREGHSIGSHTEHHVNGWKTENFSYYREVLKAGNRLHSKLFRPPYGRLSRQQASEIEKRYHIVMWDVLTGDYDQERNPGQCVQAVRDHVEPGSIIVMHDSIKALPNLQKALPEILYFLKSEGYELLPINMQDPLQVAMHSV